MHYVSEKPVTCVLPFITNGTTVQISAHLLGKYSFIYS